MGSLNKVMLIGNLGRDPEVRYTTSGTAVANFTMATTDRWKDPSSGDFKERTEWHRIVVWGKQAEIAGEYLRKGSKVYIEGSLRTTSWEQDGVKKYRTEIMARELQMLDSRGGGGGMGQPQGAPSGFESNQPPAMSDNAPTLSDDTDFEDDIPF